MKTRAKLTVIGTMQHGTYILFDRPETRQARLGEIIQDGEAFYRLVPNHNGQRASLFNVTADVKRTQEAMKRHNMTAEQWLAKAKRQEQLSQYRRAWTLRTAVRRM